MGLAPMDGITDPAFRSLISQQGAPDVIFTEFVNADTLSTGSWQQLLLLRNPSHFQPTIAQLYGSQPKHFFQLAPLLCELGFAGIDINMGCPCKKIAARGAGAGLILNPSNAQEIIRATKKGISDWIDGKNWDEMGLPTKVFNKVLTLFPFKKTAPTKRRSIPVSVKTRLGFDTIVIDDWIPALLEEEPAVISIHGRTLKQMYQGESNWDVIARAAEIIHQTKTLVLGNGDIRSLESAQKRIMETQVDGVLLGRITIGQPWIFRNLETWKSNPSQYNVFEPNKSEIFNIISQQGKLIAQLDGKDRIRKIFKYLHHYLRRMPDGENKKKQLFMTKSYEEFVKVLEDFRI